MLHNQVENELTEFAKAGRSVDEWGKFRENLIGLTDVTRSHFVKLVSELEKGLENMLAEYDTGMEPVEGKGKRARGKGVVVVWCRRQRVNSPLPQGGRCCCTAGALYYQFVPLSLVFLSVARWHASKDVCVSRATRRPVICVIGDKAFVQGLLGNELAKKHGDSGCQRYVAGQDTRESPMITETFPLSQCTLGSPWCSLACDDVSRQSITQAGDPGWHVWFGRLAAAARLHTVAQLVANARRYAGVTLWRHARHTVQHIQRLFMCWSQCRTSFSAAVGVGHMPSTAATVWRQGAYH